MNMRFSLAIFIVVIAFSADASQFASLKSSNVNLRVGPGKEYPISWTFTKSGVPVMLTAEFGQWRKVKFADQTEGWVHQSMISRKNTAVVTSSYAILYKYAADAQPIAKIEKNVIVNVLKQDKDWVKIEVNKIKGWVKKQDLWGINED
jgi:SH3-like domain-containing protein